MINSDLKTSNLRNIDWLLVGFIILHFYIDNVYFFVISCGVLFIYIIPNYAIKIPRSVKGKSFLLVVLLLGLIMGLFRINQYGIYKIVRDLFYVLNPILFILIASNYKGSNSKLIKTIAISAVIYSCLHLINVGISFGMAGGNISILRDMAGKGQFIEVLGIALFFPKNDKLTSKEFSKLFSKISFILCTISIIVSFSRTYIIMLLIIMLCILMLGQKSIYKVLGNFVKTLIGTVIVIALICKFVPTMMNEVTGKFERSLIEISSKSNWLDKSNIISNWRGYEIYCAKEQFKKAPLLEQFFGQGFGKVINTNGYEVYVSGERGGITILHNGFYTILIKTGVVGLIAYIFFFISNIFYYYINRKKNYSNRMILGIYLAIAFSTPFIVGLFRGASFLEACLLVVPLAKNNE